MKCKADQLVRLTSIKSGEYVWFNPIDVKWIREYPEGSEITFNNSTKVRVSECGEELVKLLTEED